MADRFGDRLAFQMLARGLTQKELARKSGLTDAAISRYLSNTREPNALAIRNLSLALGVSSDELLGIEKTAVDDVSKAITVLARESRHLTNDQKLTLAKTLLEIS